ncbi:hypothetical protein DFH09DRAFT_1089077 [Mycena vulgaris]|nr:hypothetical protein DFH09DRAFT_1089077 [Mycena vulgaris]
MIPLWLPLVFAPVFLLVTTFLRRKATPLPPGPLPQVAYPKINLLGLPGSVVRSGKLSSSASSAVPGVRISGPLGAANGSLEHETEVLLDSFWTVRRLSRGCAVPREVRHSPVPNSGARLSLRLGANDLRGANVLNDNSDDSARICQRISFPVVICLTPPSGPQQTILLVDPATVFSCRAVFRKLIQLDAHGISADDLIDVYWRNFPKDKLKVKLWTAFGTHEAWWFSIHNWGNVTALQGGVWTAVMSPILCGIISAMVQIFYAMRIWTLKTNAIPRLLAILIILLQETLSQEQLLRLHPVFSFWLAGSFATDILVARSMIWIVRSNLSPRYQPVTTPTQLYTAKPTLPEYSSNTESTLNRLMLNTIQTGTVTVLCAGITLALFIKFIDRNYYFAFTYILGKLYSNSFMATLNFRTPRKDCDHSESIGMRIQRQIRVAEHQKLQFGTFSVACLNACNR